MKQFNLPILFSLLALNTAGAVPSQPSIVTTNGRQIVIQRRLENGLLRAPQVFPIAGVCWNPTPIGSSNNPDWQQYHVGDLELMKKMNVNTVRTYTALPRNSTGLAVLNKCYEMGIYMIMNLGYQSDIALNVNYFKNHPALLMFEVGNEWNYNLGYGEWGSSIVECAHNVNGKAQIVQDNDSNHPVSSSLGHANDSTPYDLGVFSICGGTVDVWGFNTYVDNSLSAAVSAAKNYTSKPFYFSEYGEPALFNGQMDLDHQTTLVRNQINSMNPSLTINGGDVSGGTIFCFVDNWWKAGEPSVHNNNISEWYGVVNIYREPRGVYYAAQEIFGTYPVVGVFWGEYRITNKATGKTMRPLNGSTGLAQILSYDYSSSNTTHWNILPLYDDTYRIQNVGSTKVLRPENGANGNNVNIFQETSAALDTQKWFIQPSGPENHYKFKNKTHGRVIRIKDGSAGNNVPVVLYDDTALDSLRWLITR